MLRGNAAMPGLALLAVLLLGGCGQADSGVRVETAPGSAADDGAGSGCPDPAAAVAISSDVHATAVLRCLRETEHVPGDGEWSVTMRERATGRAMRDLVAALRLPSEPQGDRPCLAMLLAPTVVRLETASGPVDVATPKDSCGQTRSAVIAAYAALRWVEVSRKRGERLRSEAAVTAGCEGWKDMLAISARDSVEGVRGHCWRGAPRSRSASTAAVIPLDGRREATGSWRANRKVVAGSRRPRSTGWPRCCAPPVRRPGADPDMSASPSCSQNVSRSMSSSTAASGSWPPMTACGRAARNWPTCWLPSDGDLALHRAHSVCCPTERSAARRGASRRRAGRRTPSRCARSPR